MVKKSLFILFTLICAYKSKGNDIASKNIFGAETQSVICLHLNHQSKFSLGVYLQGFGRHKVLMENILNWIFT